MDVGYHQLEVTDRDAVQRLRDFVEREFGRLDILVNNAGITRDRLIARMSEEDWDLVRKINLDSVFHCSKAAASRVT